MIPSAHDNSKVELEMLTVLLVTTSRSGIDSVPVIGEWNFFLIAAFFIFKYSYF